MHIRLLRSSIVQHVLRFLSVEVRLDRRIEQRASVEDLLGFLAFLRHRVASLSVFDEEVSTVVEVTLLSEKDLSVLPIHARFLVINFVNNDVCLSV